ncbi:MAG: gamma-glutamyl-gamma-aminobutyrate hydrolase family protein, partial [Bacteroidales bacterium]
AAKYARENKIPFLGICLGMQMAVIEFSRNVLKLEDAMTTEIKTNTKNPVIDLMEDQKSLTTKGGTMRLGAYTCKIDEGSLAHTIYGKTEISERHRHRYEMNNIYVDMLSTAGLVATGKNSETSLVEIVEIPEHPFFIGVQFHPEFKSTPENPHPLFVAMVKAAMNYKKRS